MSDLPSRTESDRVRAFGDGATWTYDIWRPCSCGEWPEPYWLVIGYLTDGERESSTSHGHQSSLEAAEAQLAELKATCPQFTYWEITENRPATRISVARTEGEHPAPRSAGAVNAPEIH